MESINRFSAEEHFDYPALLDEAIETIQGANIELGPEKQKTPPELEAVLDPLCKVKEAQAFFAPTLTVQRLRKRDFKARGVEPSFEVKKWMENQHFYLVQVPVTLMPAFGWNFVRLKCWVGFEAIGDAAFPKTHDIYPESTWTEILKLQTRLELGLDEGLKFWAGLEQFDAIYQLLGATAQAKVGVVADAGARLVVGPFSYSVQRAQVLSTGVESNEVFWQLDGHEHVQREEPYLAIVLRVPKKTKAVNARGALIAYQDFDFWGAHLADWWGSFREKLRSFFSKGVPFEATSIWENVIAQ